jgi:hypothetical protein
MENDLPYRFCKTIICHTTRLVKSKKRLFFAKNQAAAKFSSDKQLTLTAKNDTL